MTEEQIEKNRIRYGEVYDERGGGQILGFPMPVIKAMLSEQKQQGNDFRIDIFEVVKTRGKNGGGFDWQETQEGQLFWDAVIEREDFDVFFERYPESLPKGATAKQIDSRYLKSVELYGEENLMPNVEVLGQIAGIPSAIYLKILDEQERQGNKKAYEPFMENRMANKSEGGFDYSSSKDGYDFWQRVLEEEDFENFFFRYPELLPKKGAEEVSTEEVVTEGGLSVDSFIENNKEALQDISKTNTPLFNALNGVLAELRISYEDGAVQVEEVEEVVEVKEDDLDLDNLMGEIDELDLDSLLDDIDDL